MAVPFDLTETARSLLNIEVNTIVRDNITAEQIPPLPHALLDVASSYARELCLLGVNLPAYFGTPAADPAAISLTWLENPGSVSDRLTVSAQTFDRLRWAAYAASRGQSPQARAIPQAKRGILDRIINNSDAIKEMFTRFHPGAGQFIGKTRAELVTMTIERGSYGLRVDDLIALQKIWDIGVEEIVAQTIVHLTGDVTTRVQDALRRPGSEALFAIHRQSVDISVACWRNLLDAIREIAGTNIRALLGPKL